MASSQCGNTRTALDALAQAITQHNFAEENEELANALAGARAAQPWGCILAAGSPTDKCSVVFRRIDSPCRRFNHSNHDAVARRKDAQLLQLFELLELRWR